MPKLPPRKRINLRLPPEVYRFVKEKAKEFNTLPGTWVREVLAEMARGGPKTLLPIPDERRARP